MYKSLTMVKLSTIGAFIVANIVGIRKVGEIAKICMLRQYLYRANPLLPQTNFGLMHLEQIFESQKVLKYRLIS